MRTKDQRLLDEALVELEKAVGHLAAAKKRLGKIPGHRDDDLAVGFGHVKRACSDATKARLRLTRLALLWRATR